MLLVFKCFWIVQPTVTKQNLLLMYHVLPLWEPYDQCVRTCFQLPFPDSYVCMMQFFYSVLSGRYWVTVGVWAIILTHVGDISGAALEGFVRFLEEDGGSLIETSIDGGMMTLCI